MQKTSILLVGMLSIAQSAPAIAAEVITPMTAAASDGSTRVLTSAQNEVDDQASDLDNQAYHVPIVLNDSVETYIEYFSTLRRDVFQSWLDSSAAYLATMKNIFRDANLPEELVYVAMIESGLNPLAVSHAKAVGPWQFMPDTARHYGLKSDHWVDERRDYLKSTLAAARHFRELHASLGSWPLVLAAYNAGMKKVRNAMRLTGSIDFWDLKESPFLLSETKSYVPKFMAVALIARDPAAYGFRVPVATSLHFDVVRIRGGMDLRAAADATDSTYATIKQLNPEINGTSTPPEGQYYPLKIPKGKRKTFLVRRAAATRAALAVNSEKMFTLKTTAFRSPSHLSGGTGGKVFSRRDTSSIPETKVTFAERFDKFDKVVQGTIVAL
ncbi:MAG TPA: lytic transglycosylase domain-containing protein [Nitrospirota bacterium]|nr:lytic transglycosylase domain-containing protein [Nitrospirota bacterium]